MNQYIALVLVAIGAFGLGYLMGLRQGVWRTLMNSTGLWGRPRELKLVKGASTKQKDWRSLKQ